METNSIQTGAATNTTAARQGFGDISGEDFFQLLIAQLTSQDPLEPMSNEQLLQQMASIREIEMNTSLTESLQSLTDQQRFGGASGLIGQYVSGRGADGDPLAGTVKAVRFAPDGSVVLDLDSGASLQLGDLEAVTSPREAAEGLIGQFVQGVDRHDLDQPTPIEGVVTGVRHDDAEILLELDTGETLRFGDVLSVGWNEQTNGDGAST